MQYAKGNRVKHPGKPDWGLGQVLETSTATSVRIFFVGAGEKKLSLTHVIPILVTGAEAKDPVLDSHLFNPVGKGNKHVSLPRAIDEFLELFPQGFYGTKYLEEERDYKVAAHELALDLLGRKTFENLLAVHEFEEICKRALRLANATNLIFSNEKMALNDGLSNLGSKKQFAESLHNLLFGEEEMDARFKAFFDVLNEINAAKWTIATYFPFLFFPEQHIFLKPMVTQEAAELLSMDINYRPQLNWLTYKCVLEFAEGLRTQLAELQPRDMIDVQSFIWCVASNK